jgi:hypothetical protein
LKIDFGNVDDDGNGQQIKDLVENAFGKLAAIAEYKQLYVAMPHANDYTKFTPETKNKNRLELYICSTPTLPRSREFAGKLEKLKFSGKEYKLEKGQCDRLAIDIDLTFEEMLDEGGNLFAVRRNNQIWMLQDLFHPTLKEEVTIDILRELCLFLEGKRIPYDASGLIAKIMTDINKAEFEQLQKQAKDYARDIAAKQEAFTNSLRSLETFRKTIDNYRFHDEDLALQMAKRVMKMPMIERIGKLPNRNDGIQILTKDIIQGPFNFGKWIIKISPDMSPSLGIYPAEIIGTPTNKVRHPHDTSETQGQYNMCIGGFNEEIIRSQKNGEWDKALTFYRLFITNYVSAHRFIELEKFLGAIMGKKEFEEAFKEATKNSKIQPETHDRIEIISLYGNELTINGVVKKNGSSDRDVIILQ